MTRRLLRILMARLDASPLPFNDPVRLDLEAELIRLMVGTDGAARARIESSLARRWN